MSLEPAPTLKRLFQHLSPTSEKQTVCSLFKKKVKKSQLNLSTHLSCSNFQQDHGTLHSRPSSVCDQFVEQISRISRRILCSLPPHIQSFKKIMAPSVFSKVPSYGLPPKFCHWVQNLILQKAEQLGFSHYGRNNSAEQRLV